MQAYILEACSGKALQIKANQTITIVDLEGQQVVDFFAEVQGRAEEFLSTGVTIDCNDSLALKVGDTLYTNLYRPMFKVLADDVGKHDLLHPCCRPEMYDFFYKNGENHSNCLDNINSSLNEHRPTITPVNLFMNTRIGADGRIWVDAPLSQPGDKITLKAMLDVRVGMAACSVSESQCNGGKCSAVKVIIE